MAFDATVRQSIERDVAAYVEPIRPPALCRDEFDIGYRMYQQSIEIFAIRPEIMRHYPVAKATYIRTRDVWRVYWRKRDHKWHGYALLPEAADLARVLQEVDADPAGCFLGVIPRPDAMASQWKWGPLRPLGLWPDPANNRIRGTAWWSACPVNHDPSRLSCRLR